MSDPSDSLPQILVALEQLQAENATLHQSLLELQSATSSVTPATTLNPPPPQEPYYEPKVSLPHKFRWNACTRFHQVGLLVETTSPLLEDFPTFLTEFEATFGEMDRRRAALTKIYSLQQGNCATSTYTSEFR